MTAAKRQQEEAERERPGVHRNDHLVLISSQLIKTLMTGRFNACLKRPCICMQGV